MHTGGSFTAACLASRRAAWVAQRYRTGMTSELLGEQSSTLGCNLVLEAELGQIASLLSPSISVSFHENNVANPRCKTFQKLGAKSALERPCAFVSGG